MGKILGIEIYYLRTLFIDGALCIILVLQLGIVVSTSININFQEYIYRIADIKKSFLYNNQWLSFFEILTKVIFRYEIFISSIETNIRQIQSDCIVIVSLLSFYQAFAIPHTIQIYTKGRLQKK